MLGEVQSRLEAHFTLLARQRSTRGYPVFALEHDLSPDDVVNLGAALSEDLTTSRAVRAEYWLPWIVFAAEVGYAYDGDEYWTSFRNRIPGWERFGDRDVIRDLFVKLGAEFSGFTPKGRFAEHFTIIAWPIAHSILPQDLQQRFARHLHEVRWELASQIGRGIAGIAGVLASGPQEGSSRYRNLLQQTDLLAHVVLALRDQDIDDAASPIYKPTLSRIVGDIGRRRIAAGWLRETTRILRESRTNVSADFGRPDRTQTAEAGRTAQGVRLVAQRRADGRWSLGTSLPDIQSLMRFGGLDPKILNDTRVRMFDVTDSWRPGRALLAMSRKEFPITRLPPVPRAPVIQAESSGQLDALLSSAACVVGESPWLLRVQDDGIARQVLGKHIRSHELYVVVAGAPLDDETVRDLGASEEPSTIPDAKFYVIDTGEQISDRQLAAIARAQLGFSVRVNIDPLGLLPRLDGANGSTVWLPDEELLLRISTDHEVMEFVVSVDTKETLRIAAHGRREFVVSAGNLPLGRHAISVHTIAAGAHGTSARGAEAETIMVEIRAPAPWQTAIRTKAGFSAAVHPFGARLEQLLDRSASISINGPSDRTVHVEAVPRDPNGHAAAVCELGNLRLPTDKETVRRVLEHLTDERFSDAIMSSPHVDLRFKVEELGAASIGFPHVVQPLRWKRETLNGTQKARLVDEAGKDDEVRIDRYDVVTPDKAAPLDRRDCAKGIDIAYPGSLVAVRLKDKWTSTLIGSAMVQKRTSLKDIGAEIRFAIEDPKKLGRLLTLYRLWRIARPLGPLAAVRKSKVLDEFEDRVAFLMCGKQWAVGARSFRAGGGDEASVVALQREVGGSAGFAARIRGMDWSRYRSDSGNLIAEFSRHSATYKVCDDGDLCKLSVELAFQPAAVPPNDETGRLAKLSLNGVLARGAFFGRVMASELGKRAKRPAEQEST